MKGTKRNVYKKIVVENNGRVEAYLIRQEVYEHFEGQLENGKIEGNLAERILEDQSIREGGRLAEVMSQILPEGSKRALENWIIDSTSEALENGECIPIQSPSALGRALVVTALKALTMPNQKFSAKVNGGDLVLNYRKVMVPATTPSSNGADVL